MPAFDDHYRELRKILSPDYSDLSSEELEQLFEERVGVHPEDIEFSLRDIGRGLSQVGRAIAPALPAIGTGVGALFGVPQVGAIAEVVNKSVEIS